MVRGKSMQANNGCHFGEVGLVCNSTCCTLRASQFLGRTGDFHPLSSMLYCASGIWDACPTLAANDFHAVWQFSSSGCQRAACFIVDYGALGSPCGDLEFEFIRDWLYTTCHWQCRYQLQREQRCLGKRAIAA